MRVRSAAKASMVSTERRFWCWDTKLRAMRAQRELNQRGAALTLRRALCVLLRSDVQRPVFHFAATAIE